MGTSLNIGILIQTKKKAGRIFFIHTAMQFKCYSRD
jgi:hypothetical protein